jgi:hypothetical protein
MDQEVSGKQPPGVPEAIAFPAGAIAFTADAIAFTTEAIADTSRRIAPDPRTPCVRVKTAAKGGVKKRFTL